MKILRIQFQNLNSLPFGDIDLEPFAQTGIFAITGPTGAGKSTILDAITLALYGRASRYDRQTNPADMMSRHTGHSQAQVVFEVRGKRYRAEWQLNRSRGKSDGRVQKPQHRLYDEQEYPVAQNHTETVAQVEALTGLDYDRFTRSVLLAQGQFAQFLKATETQRAELLESLTGTSVYSELSKLAHQQTSHREQALREKEAVLGNVLLLTEEERQQKRTAIACLDEELSKLRTRQETLAATLHRGQQLAALRQSDAQLAQRLQQLAGEREQAAPQLQRLAHHREGEPYHTALQSVDRLKNQAEKEATQRDEAEAECRRSSIAYHSAIAASRQVVERLLQTARQAIETAQRERQTLEVTLLPLQQWLADHAAHATLETALPGLTGTLQTLAHNRTQLLETGRDIAELIRQREQLAPAPLEAHVKEAEKLAHQTRERLQKAQSAVAGLLQGRKAEELHEQAQKLEKKATALLKLEAALKKQEDASQEGAVLADRQAGLEAEIKTIEEQKEATEREAEEQKKLLEEARARVVMLEKVASYETQRALLQKGVPCPLCGAKEHPLAHRSEEVLRDIEEARRNLSVAEGAYNTAAKEVLVAADYLARTKEALNQTIQRRGELRRQQTKDYDDFTQLAQRLRIYTSESLQDATEKNDRARADLDQRLATLREAEAALTEAKVAHAEATGEETRAREALANRLETLNGLEARLQTLHQQNEQRTAEAKRLEEELAEALRPYQLALPPTGEEATLRRQLEARFQQYQARQKEEATLRSKITAAEHQIAVLTQRLAHQQERTATLLHSLPEEETPDEATVARLVRQWQTVEDAVSGVETARTAVTQRTAALSERRNRCRETDAALAKEHEALCQRLAASPFGTLEEYRRSRLSPSEVAEIETLQRRLDEEQNRLASQQEQLRQQMAQLHDAPEGDALTALEADHKTVGATLLETADQRSRLLKALEDDDANRQKHRDLAQAIEADRAQLAVWQKLDHLIGSANGAKFSRFAQGLSLDILIRHANRHLARLTDRYLLQRSAAGELLMEIVDLHQARAVRPMQSLSGGESFLVSLALALGLSDLAGRNARIDSLFIDEGFGTLDADTLDIAVSALDSLRLHHKTVGVISHVDLLKERIPMQIRVVKQPGGVSRLELPKK